MSEWWLGIGNVHCILVVESQYDVEVDDDVLTVKTPIAIAPSDSVLAVLQLVHLDNPRSVRQIVQFVRRITSTKSTNVVQVYLEPHRAAIPLAKLNAVKVNIQPKVHWINPVCECVQI